MLRYIYLILLVLVLPFSAYSGEQIIHIDIEGNKIVSKATIIAKIKVRAGQAYNENIINKDVKNLNATGFFETVEVEKDDAPGGLKIIFKVKEKPVLKKIVIKGAKFIRSKQILESTDLKEGGFVDEYSLKQAAKKIKDLYVIKGFSQAKVDFELSKARDKNEAEVKFLINENRILKVRQVTVEGNQSMSSRRIIRLMKTRKAWLFNRGIFKEDVIADDIKRVTDFYKLEGFSDVRVNIDPEYKAKGVYLAVKIVEGRRYYIGQIKINGNKEVSLEDVLAVMQLKTGSIFSEQVVYQESSQIREVYIDRGYIFSRVEPFSFFNPETEKVEVTYEITENDIAYVEDITIKGNIKTKDKVIRRELKIYPGDRFDGKKIRRSKEKLENLGFFEEVRFGTEPGSKDNYVDLVTEVKEAKTGYLSFGGGYSSIDEFIGFVELRQRNFDYRNFSTFTGAGQDLSLMFSIGTLTDRYQLSFTNPWIFDTPVYFGFDAYRKGHKRDDEVGYGYEQTVTGGALRLGRRLTERWDGMVGYRLDNVDISDVTDDSTSELKSETGSTNLSSGEVRLNFDSRDNVFATLKGILFNNTFQLTGGPFAGDRDFTKYITRLSFYVPAINKSVVELRLRAGFADPFSDTTKVPIYERFFAGGSGSIRGYPERKVGPIDSGTDDPIGGESMFIGNIEYTYPLADFLKAATFFDSGEVWKTNSDFLGGDLKRSIGLGLRVKTPIGPVSIDYGWPLDEIPGEEKEGRFHFNVSRAF
jgi:outer membrane protein insertion porin family